MAFPKHRDIFLAKCLLESIEDENYRFVMWLNCFESDIGEKNNVQ